MKLAYLSRAEIDDEKWNRCINESPNGIVYALSWFLDNWPEEWAALVEQADGRYLTVMPVQIRRRWGIRHIYQHPMVPELGVFSVHPSFGADHFRTFVTQAFAPFRYVAKYRFHTGSPLFCSSKGVSTRYVTHHLRLDQPYSAIQRCYSTNRRRNLKKSQRYTQRVVKSQNIMPLTKMHGQYTVPRIDKKQGIIDSNVPWTGSNIITLYSAAQQAGVARLYYVVNESGQYLAGGLYLFYHQKIIYYFGSATSRGLAWQSMTYLMDEIICQHAGTAYVFDFEGSPDPGVARFYRSFGSHPVNFYEVQILRLPRLLRWVNDLRRQWQRKLMGYDTKAM